MGGSVAVELARLQPDRVPGSLAVGSGGADEPGPCRCRRSWTAWVPGSSGVRGFAGCAGSLADPDSDVGAPEEQIASLHLQCPGWAVAWRLLPAVEVLPAVAYPSPNNRCT